MVPKVSILISCYEDKMLASRLTEVLPLIREEYARRGIVDTAANDATFAEGRTILLAMSLKFSKEDSPIITMIRPRLLLPSRKTTERSSCARKSDGNDSVLLVRTSCVLYAIKKASKEIRTYARCDFCVIWISK